MTKQTKFFSSDDLLAMCRVWHGLHAAYLAAVKISGNLTDDAEFDRADAETTAASNRADDLFLDIAKTRPSTLEAYFAQLEVLRVRFRLTKGTNLEEPFFPSKWDEAMHQVLEFAEDVRPSASEGLRALCGLPPLLTADGNAAPVDTPAIAAE